MKVRRVRILWNMLILAALSALLLWVLRAHAPANPDAIAWGTGAGLACGAFHWSRLRQRIARRGRRFQPNRILVRFVSPFEVLLLAIASSHYLLIALVVVILLALVLDWFTGRWWSLLAGSFGLGASVVVAALVARHERRRGPVCYQYRSEAWGGAEALLYQVGRVRKPLASRGTVFVQGELWQAESVTRGPIETGARVALRGCEETGVMV